MWYVTGRRARYGIHYSMPKQRKYTEEILAPIVARCTTMAEVCRELGVATNSGGTHSYITKRVREYELDTSHFLGKAHQKGKPGRKFDPAQFKEILVRDSKYTRCHLKRHLLEEGLLENTCSLCGLTGEWHGKPLRMVLDHVNGDGRDNRLENLRMLCPNCNSQQPTFCGRKNKGRARNW